MLALTALQSLMTFVFCLVCVLLILLILIQKGRGGGLSGAFGGVGSYSPFGTKTGDALTWATVILTGMFLLMAVLSNYVYKPQKLTGLGVTPAPATQTAMPIDAGEGSEGAIPVAPGGSAVVPVPSPAPAETPAAVPVTVTPVTATPTPAAPATQPSGPRVQGEQ
jgi:preprotein translocase subunit SecG